MEYVGAWTRTVNAGIRLREGPSSRAEIVSELEESTPLRVLAASGSWYRVRLPDGRDGFVAARLTEAVVEPLRRQLVENASALFSSPSHGAPVMENVEAGTEFAVLGSYEGFLFVQSLNGNTGWLAGKPTSGPTSAPVAGPVAGAG